MKKLFEELGVLSLWLMERLQMMKKSNILCLFLWINSLFSQEIELSGYVKFMPSFNRTKQLKNVDKWDLNTNDRLRLRANITDQFQLKIENKIFGSYGDTKRSFQNIITELTPLDEYFDLNLTILNSENYYLLNRIDRLSLDYITGNLQLTIGRQRIAWGTSWAWNPVDLFNPSSPLDFDNEEKNGADAARLQYFLNYNSSVDIVYKHASDKNHRNLAIKYLNSFMEYDLHFILGYQRDYPYLGVAWAGDIQGAGFRGEFVYHHSNSKFISVNGNIFNYSDKSYLVANLSFDYTFESSLYIHSEILYNDVSLDRSTFINTYLNSLSFSRFLVFYETAYQIADLARVNMILIDNPDLNDYSVLATYSNSLYENTDLSIISLYSKNTFNLENIALFCRLKYSF
jgi:hypothetical protein